MTSNALAGLDNVDPLTACSPTGSSEDGSSSSVSVVAAGKVSGVKSENNKLILLQTIPLIRQLKGSA